MLNHDLLMASLIWGFISVWLLFLWGCLSFLLRKIGLFSDTIEQRRTRIVSAFRWAWMLPMHIAWIILALALVW
jgi:hypothetical protein